MGHLVGHDPLQLVAVEAGEQPFGHRDVRRGGSRPVANALGSWSGTIQILGLGKPGAMAISSTTFTSWRCSGVAGSTSPGGRGPEHPLRAERHEYQQIPSATSVVKIPMTGIDVMV